MAEIDLEKLIDKEKFQVFVCMSSAALPFITFRHPWFVINEKGKISRYEIKRSRNVDKNMGYLHINAQKPFEGMPFFFGINYFFQDTVLLKTIEGLEDSSAKKMIDFIKSSSKNYPLIRRYSLIGPNCGTYVEWILKHFSDLHIKLPWNAIGKNYNKLLPIEGHIIN